MTAIIIWCFAYATYLVFAGTLSADELVVAAVLASLAALWAYVIRENTRRRFSAAREQIGPVLRAVAGLLPATGRTGVILLDAALHGSSPGRAMPCRFQLRLAEDPRERSRRAVAVLCASLAPNRFVVNVERARGEALLHAIDAGSREPDPEWLQ